MRRSHKTMYNGLQIYYTACSCSIRAFFFMRSSSSLSCAISDAFRCRLGVTGDVAVVVVVVGAGAGVVA